MGRLNRRLLLASAAGLLAVKGCAPVQGRIEIPPAETPSASEEHQTLEGLRPPKRKDRPVVGIVVASGAETTDVVVPFSVLAQSGLVDLHIVAKQVSPIRLRPALSILPSIDTATFDRKFPQGADYLIVPAMIGIDDPILFEWLRRQHQGGAVICGICSGALVLSAAGLIGPRRATTHWSRVAELRQANPTMTWVKNRRYVVDDRLSTTTGISASLPFSLALVEAIGSREHAQRLARTLGASSWGAAHDSDAFHYTVDTVATEIANLGEFWNHVSFEIPVHDGVDELALALISDAYCETERASARAIGNTKSVVVGERGLAIIPSRTRNGASPAYLPRISAGRALDWALFDVSRRFGSESARLAALNMEYPFARQSLVQRGPT